MRIKIYLLSLSFKNVRLFYYIPLFFLFILVPLNNWVIINEIGINNCFIHIMDTAQTFIPIVSTWWVFCVIKEYIDGDGNELLYAYKSQGKTRVSEILLIFVWYCLHVSLLFLVYTLIYGIILLEYIRIVMQIFVFIGAFYFFIYAFRSTSISYMFILVYYFMTLFFSQDNVFSYISIFSLNTSMTTDVLIRYIYLFPVGLLFFALGAFLNKRYFR